LRAALYRESGLVHRREGVIELSGRHGPLAIPERTYGSGTKS
jgi:hypothetical protein